MRFAAASRSWRPALPRMTTTTRRPLRAAVRAMDEPEADAGDEMMPAAVEVLLETGQASVSMLQRRLKLGYSRAARIVDEMETRGIVGQFEGSKPRQILITKEQWQGLKMKGAYGLTPPEDSELPPPDGENEAQ